MSTDGVTSFSNGLRVSLGPAGTDLKDQVTQDDVEKLLEAAKSHPGFRAHSERYEFRLRTLNGQAVLELKEKNWASKLKSAVTGERKSNERKAAAEAIGRLFQIPKFFQDDQRLNSAQARTFASTITGKVDQFLIDQAGGKLELPELTEDKWKEVLQETHNAVSDEVDESSGLYKKTLNEVQRTRIENANSGFELVMGVPGQAGSDLQGVEAVNFGFSRLRQASGLGDSHVGERAFQVAKRNLMSIARSGFQQRWLTSAHARCLEKYGMGAVLNSAQPQRTAFHIRSEDGERSPSAVITLKTSGTLTLGGQPDGWSADLPPTLASVDFNAEVTIKVKWSALSGDYFDFNQADVVKVQERFLTLAPKAS